MTGADDAAATQVIAVTADLMDRSKITGALSNAASVNVVRSLRAAVDAVESLQGGSIAVVLVDLTRVEDAGELAQLQTSADPSVALRVVAFGSHVDDARLAAAAEAGAEALARSVFFRRLQAGEILA